MSLEVPVENRDLEVSSTAFGVMALCNTPVQLMRGRRPIPYSAKAEKSKNTSFMISQLPQFAILA